MFTVANVGSLISANKLRQIIGVKSISTVQDYLSFLEDTYLIHLLSKFAWSYKKQLANPRKIYFIDNGLQTAISPSATEDWERKFENLIFWELRRLSKEIYYFNENNHECDFVICKGNKPTIVIQVCAELNVDNKIRERQGVEEAMDFFKMESGYIITMNQSDKIIIGSKTIEVLPFSTIGLKEYFC